MVKTESSFGRVNGGAVSEGKTRWTWKPGKSLKQHDLGGAHLASEVVTETRKSH